MQRREKQGKGETVQSGKPQRICMAARGYEQQSNGTARLGHAVRSKGKAKNQKTTETIPSRTPMSKKYLRRLVQ